MLRLTCHLCVSMVCYHSASICSASEADKLNMRPYCALFPGSKRWILDVTGNQAAVHKAALDDKQEIELLLCQSGPWLNCEG